MNLLKSIHRMIFGEPKLEQEEVDDMLYCIKNHNYAKHYAKYDYDDVVMLLKYIKTEETYNEEMVNNIINNIINHMDNYIKYIRNNRLYSSQQKIDNSKYNEYLIFKLYGHTSDIKLQVKIMYHLINLSKRSQYEPTVSNQYYYYYISYFSIDFTYIASIGILTQHLKLKFLL